MNFFLLALFSINNFKTILNKV